jgi:ATP-dependent Clp protease ATP-binding subunit ClpC
MFERFTDKARRTVILAQEEARMLNHNYVGTEHLLLSLLEERAMGAMAGKALAETGVTRDEALDHVCEIIGRGHTEATGHIPFTPRARSVLEEGLRTALGLGHGYIGPEHLLAGLLAAEKSVAAQTLMRCGVAPATVRRRLGELFDEAAALGTPAPKAEHGFALSA